MKLTMERQVWRHRALLWSLVKRELRSRYIGSVMGLVWSVIHPLTMLVIYTFVFSVILKARPVRVYEGSDTVNYAIFLCCGLIPWNCVLDTLGAACNTIAGNSGLIKRVKFPISILPAQAIVTGYVTFAISMSLFVLFLVCLPASRIETPAKSRIRIEAQGRIAEAPQVMTVGLAPKEGAAGALWGEVEIEGQATSASVTGIERVAPATEVHPRPFPGWFLLALPALMAFQFFCLLGPAYLLATLNVFFRDTAQIVTVCLQVLFWATPIVYPVGVLASRSPLAAWWFRLNPFGRLVDLYRYVLIRHGETAPPLPWGGALYLFALGMVCYVAGRYLFKQSRPHFVDEV